MMNKPNTPTLKMGYVFRTYEMHRYFKRAGKYVQKALQYIHYVAFYYDEKSSLLAQETLSNIYDKASDELSKIENYLEAYDIDIHTDFKSEQVFEITTKFESKYSKFLVRVDKVLLKLDALNQTQQITSVEYKELDTNARKQLGKISERVIREKKKLMNYKKKREERQLNQQQEDTKLEVENV